MTDNYNTDPVMWKNYHDSFRAFGDKLKALRVVVVDGHVHIDGAGYVARFTDTPSAVKCLKDAGFMPEEFAIHCPASER